MNGNVNIGQITRMITDVLVMVPRLAPWLLVLVLMLRLLKTAAQQWRQPLDLPTAQTFAWMAAGIAALAYAGVKL